MICRNRNRNEVNKLLFNTVEERRNLVESGSTSYGDNLLGMMLAESNKHVEECLLLVEECNTVYVAGSDTTTSMLIWTMFLLAAYPEWQQRARHGVYEVCRDEDPADGDAISKLKLLSMILNESLRLYPPAAVITRCCFQDVEIGDLQIPRGMGIHIPILALHHDKTLWGPDANDFNPRRFEHGVSKACKHPNGFLPFSFGPRGCSDKTSRCSKPKLSSP